MRSSYPSKLVLMYHSLTSEDYPHVLGSFPVHINEFKIQIQKFINVGYITKSSECLRQTPESGEKWLFITSDDGTVDWTRNALPWCESQKLATHTAIITGTWQTNPTYPLAHCIQLVLSLRSPRELELIANRVNQHLTLDQRNYVHSTYSYETDWIRRVIKGGCNLILTDMQARETIGKLTNHENDLLEQRFEQASFYQNFSYAEVGSHSVSHAAMGIDVENYVQTEIHESKQQLINAGIKQSNFFTLPMKPRFGATVDSLIPPLVNMGFEGLLYSSYDSGWDGNSFVIPRLDPKHIDAFFKQAQN